MGFWWWVFWALSCSSSCSASSKYGALGQVMEVVAGYELRREDLRGLPAVTRVTWHWKIIGSLYVSERERERWRQKKWWGFGFVGWWWVCEEKLVNGRIIYLWCGEGRVSGSLSLSRVEGVISFCPSRAWPLNITHAYFSVKLVFSYSNYVSNHAWRQSTSSCWAPKSPSSPLDSSTLLNNKILLLQNKKTNIVII